MSEEVDEESLANESLEVERNETEMVICLACGEVHEGDDDSPCPRCQSGGNTEYRNHWQKYGANSE